MTTGNCPTHGVSPVLSFVGELGVRHLHLACGCTLEVAQHPYIGDVVRFQGQLYLVDDLLAGSAEIKNLNGAQTVPIDSLEFIGADTLTGMHASYAVAVPRGPSRYFPSVDRGDMIHTPLRPVPSWQARGWWDEDVKLAARSSKRPEKLDDTSHVSGVSTADFIKREVKRLEKVQETGGASDIAAARSTVAQTPLELGSVKKRKGDW